ncbi:trypsin-like peptidase domain-containing protein, partial [archaeon]|nr:trypsin-like peptidase domain-containing protein [archaeon]
SKEELSNIYQDQTTLENNLKELASALSKEKLSQKAKIALLNKYSMAVTLVLNKDSARINKLVKHNEGLANLINEVSTKVEDVQTSFLELRAKTYRPENSERINKIITPCVRVSCYLEVGSGTVIYSKQEGEFFYNYLTTALHVVQGATEGKAITVVTFDKEGDEDDSFSEEVKLIRMNERKDLAFIEIVSDYELSHAKIASKEKAENIQRFDDVYAVGCPLGYEPLQTRGEITATNKVLGEETYWMTNANTIFGNSGGGIFLSETNEFIGMLARISAYNNFINIAVPHMGIFVPAPHLYEWFESENLQFLYDDSFNRKDCLKKGVQLNTGHQMQEPVQEEDPSTLKPVLR